MHSQPPFSGICHFFGAEQNLKGNLDSDVMLMGVPFDLGTTYRPGARFGPRAVREASQLYINDYHPNLDLCPDKLLKLVDGGDFTVIPGYLERTISLIEKQAFNLLNANIKSSMVCVGGDHTISLPLLRALNRHLKKPVSLLHFDAHVDTWKNSFGAAIGHGSPFYHAVEEKLINPQTSVQIGIRSPLDLHTKKYTNQHGFTIIPALKVHTENDPTSIAKTLINVLGDNPVYLTFDIDCIDPSQAPGTGSPEPGGLFSWQVLAILEYLIPLNFVGMDLVEVSPIYDQSGITAHLAANIIWIYLTLIASRKLMSK
ncbi:MAG: agmatinase [Neisseriaceae bacterium]